MAIEKRFASEEYVNENIIAARPDWNQNDPTAIDYIKNRPFYSEISDITLINNQTLTSASIDDLNEPYEINFEDNTKFINHGDECIVIFDGVEYVINAFEMNQVAPLALGGHRKHILLGDFDLEGHAPTFNNYPFAIVLTLMGDIEAVCRRAFVVVYNNENSITEHTVTVIHKQEQVTELDEKFIPNSLKAGRNVAGKEFHEYDYDADKEVSYIAASNAEIFNDYEYNIAIGEYSHAEGCYTHAIGSFSHAEGCESIASGDYSHVEGYATTASANYTHAEGWCAIASGNYQHAQGKFNIEDKESKYAHIVGNGNYATRSNAHTLDWSGNAWFAGDVYVGGTSQDDASKLGEKDWNVNDESSAAYIKNRPFYTADPVEVVLVEETTVEIDSILYTQISSNLPLVEEQAYTVIFNETEYECVAYNLQGITVIGNGSIVIPSATQGNNEPFLLAYSDGRFELGVTNEGTYIVKVSTMQSDVIQIDEKYIPDTVKVGKKVEGQVFTITNDDETPTEVTAGVGAEIFNNYKEDSGISTYLLRAQDINIATGDYSHAEGYGTTASGDYSHAEGFLTMASGESSHVEGSSTRASGYGAHAEGNATAATSFYSHAEGHATIASGDTSHAEGSGTIASGNTSHAEGFNTEASGDYQHVQGKYNIEDTSNKYAHIVGNGTADAKRSNAHTLDWSGNAEYKGDVKANACGGEKPISLVETATIAKVLYGNITTPMEDFNSGSPFVSADITFNDIKTAYDAGRDVKLKWGSYIYSLGYESDTQFGFSCNGIAIDNIINVLSSGDIAVSNAFVK